MSDSNAQPGSGGGVSAETASRAQIRREADERYVAAVRVGDADTFGRLFDAWIDPVHDRLVRMGVDDDRAAAIEVSAFVAAWRDINRGGGASTFGADVVRVAMREAQGDRNPSVDTTSAHERIRRATSLAAAGSDPGVALLFFEAAEALGQTAREVLDLQVRHGFTAEEVAEVLNRRREEVAALAGRLPAAFDAVVRARLVWGAGMPELMGGGDELDAVRDDLTSAGVSTFGPDAVRVLNRRIREDDRLRARTMVPLGAVAILGAIPLASASPDHKRDVAAGLSAAGVPLGRSEWSTKGRRPTAADASAAAAAVARERGAATAAPRGGERTAYGNASPAKGAGVAGAAAAAGATAASAPSAAADPTPDEAVPGRRPPKEMVVEPGSLDHDDGSDRRPLLVVAAVVALLVAVGVGIWLLGGGDDDQDVASDGARATTTTTEPTTTTSTRRSTTTSTTTEPPVTTTGAEGTPTTTVINPTPIAPPVTVPGPSPRPTVPVPTTAPREGYSVTFGVSRGADTSVPSPYRRSNAPVAQWSATGNVSAVQVLDPFGNEVGAGMANSVPVCPGGWAGDTCTATPGPYAYSIRYVVDGLELGQVRTLTIDP